MLKSIRNEKSSTPKTLRQVIRAKLAKTVLNVDSLDVNGGHITIKELYNTPYVAGMTNVVFSVSVPTKKFSFKYGKLHITSAVVGFQLIAADCYWNEGTETYVWDGDKSFKMHVEEEFINVATMLRGKQLNIDEKGQWYMADGLEFFDDIGIAGALGVAIKNNSSKDDIKAVLEFALLNCLIPESEW